jgi:phenylalanyl-tRNA synthetase alpha chain
VLLRLVIRDLERTLTSAEANVLRDEIYAALHCGSVKTWASKEMQL